MFNVQMTSTTMKLFDVACLCLLIWCEITFGDENGQKTGPVVVTEGSDVILACSLSINIQSKLFDWKKDGQKEVFLYDAGLHYNNGRTGQDEQFTGRVSHFPDELKNGNASIIIRNTKVADSGDYTCDFPRLKPRQIFHIQLLVDQVLKDRSEENIPGASPKPYVTTVNTEDGVLLQCEVQGASPKPKVELKDSSGNIVSPKGEKVTERGDRYDIILQAALTKTDNFRCVVTQEEIYHQTNAEIYATINDPTPPESGNNTGWIFGGVVSIVSILIIVLGGIFIRHLIKQNREKDEQLRRSQSQPSPSTPLTNGST